MPAFVFVYECLKVHVDVPCRFLNQLKEGERVNYEGDTRSLL